MIITMTRATGPTDECGDTKTTTTFAAADHYLRHWSHTAPKNGGYDKVDFEISNEETGDVIYKGRYDLKHWHTETANLKAHVMDYLTFTAGERCPSHMSTDDYNAFIGRADIGLIMREEARELIKLFKGQP